MRILLAHNSLYYPSHGGGDKSNRLLMEALASRGHEVTVVARVEDFGARPHTRLLRELAERRVEVRDENSTSIRFQLDGTEVRVLTGNPMLRTFFATQVDEFDPDVIVASTDDPAHLMLQRALRVARARVVYLIRATVALPFGPDSALRSEAKTAALRAVDGAVAVSEYVAEYARRWGRMEAVYAPISLLERREFPCAGRIGNRFVTMVNPCGVKGISILLALAEQMPEVPFAAVPTWGTTAADIIALRRHPNITILPPADDMDRIFEQTRVALVPSLWAEARSRIILEAMVHGIPVMASDVGGLREAMLGVDYLLPVQSVARYRHATDELMVPVAEIPAQDIGPWRSTLARLLSDKRHYADISAASRRAALAYAGTLTAEPFENFLRQVAEAPRRERHVGHGRSGREEALSSERRRLLAQRLRQKQRHADRRIPN